MYELVNNKIGFLVDNNGPNIVHDEFTDWGQCWQKKMWNSTIATEVMNNYISSTVISGAKKQTHFSGKSIGNTIIYNNGISFSE